jgi:hypothetical protein
VFGVTGCEGIIPPSVDVVFAVFDADVDASSALAFWAAAFVLQAGEVVLAVRGCLLAGSTRYDRFRTPRTNPCGRLGGGLLVV